MKYLNSLKDDNLDERELFLRGKIYQHCCTVLILLLFCNIVFKDIFNLPPIDSYIIISIAVTDLYVEMIYHEIYPISFKTQRTVILAMGITGILLVVLSCYHIIVEQFDMFSQNTFSEYGINLIVGICFSIILLAYCIRQVYNKKENKKYKGEGIC